MVNGPTANKLDKELSSTLISQHILVSLKIANIMGRVRAKLQEEIYIVVIGIIVKRQAEVSKIKTC